MTKKPSKRARQAPPPRRSFPWLLILAVGSVALLFAYQWISATDDGPAGDAGSEDTQGIVSIIYRVDPREWPGRPPNLCELVDHYELGGTARAATLYLNRRGADCAPADRQISAGEQVLIALSAPPGFAICARESASCR